MKVDLTEPKGFVDSISSKYSKFEDDKMFEELYTTLLDKELWLTGNEERLIKFSELEQDHIKNIIEMLNTNGRSYKVRLEKSLTKLAPQFIEKLQKYLHIEE